MKNLAMVIVATLALAGCQPQPAKLLKQEPGSWSATFTLDSFDVPNAPPSYRADLEKALANRSAIAVCVTPEQAAKSDLVSELVNGQSLKNCQFEANSADAGKLMVDAMCEDPKGRPVDLSIEGSADSKAADVAITMSGDEQADAPVMVKLRAVLKHNGPCDAVPAKGGVGKKS
jgi:hypothetical protein